MKGYPFNYVREVRLPLLVELSGPVSGSYSGMNNLDARASRFFREVSDPELPTTDGDWSEMVRVSP